MVIRRTSQGGLCAAVRAGRARVGAGGSAAKSRGLIPANRGGKADTFQCVSKEGGQLFLMLQMYHDKRIVPRSVLFILCL